MPYGIICVQGLSLLKYSPLLPARYETPEEPPGAKFVQFAHRTIDYMSDIAALFADTVDMQDENSVSQFVANIR